MLDGVLAGSTLTMDRAVQNFRTYTGATPAAAAAIAATNPARMLGLDAQIGSLAPGRSADIAVLSPAGEVVATMLRGRIVFKR